MFCFGKLEKYSCSTGICCGGLQQSSPHTPQHTHTHIWRNHMGLYTIRPLSVAQLPREYMINSFLVLSRAVEEQSHSSVILGVICWHNFNVNKKSSYFLTARSGKLQNLAIVLTNVATSFSSGCSSSSPSSSCVVGALQKELKYSSGNNVLNARILHGNVAGIPDNRSNGGQNKPFTGIF